MISQSVSQSQATSSFIYKTEEWRSQLGVSLGFLAIPACGRIILSKAVDRCGLSGCCYLAYRRYKKESVMRVLRILLLHAYFREKAPVSPIFPYRASPLSHIRCTVD